LNVQKENINPKENIRLSIQTLKKSFQIENISSAWETSPIGAPGGNFINLAIKIKTNLDLAAIKQQFRNLEAKSGRIRTENKFEPRVIDIDITIFNNHILDPDIWNYAYLAVPISEIIPELLNPKTGESIADAATRLTPTTYIKKLNLTFL